MKRMRHAKSVKASDFVLSKMYSSQYYEKTSRT